MEAAAAVSYHGLPITPSFLRSHNVSALGPACGTRLFSKRPLTGPLKSLPCLAKASQSSTAVTEDQKMQSPTKAFKPLESIEVLDLQGRSISVVDLWKDRRVVVGFTRHFGCVLCMKRADLLTSRKDDFDAANVSLIIIGPGNVEQANAFAHDRKFAGEVYADPKSATHKALEFTSGVGSTVSLTTGLRVISAYLEGYRQDWDLSFEKDTVSKGGWQQGGVLVAGPGKDNIVYLFKDIKAGDEPNMDEVVKAACGTVTVNPYT